MYHFFVTSCIRSNIRSATDFHTVCNAQVTSVSDGIPLSSPFPHFIQLSNLMVYHQFLEVILNTTSLIETNNRYPHTGVLKCGHDRDLDRYCKIIEQAGPDD